MDCMDACAADPAKIQAGVCGCGRLDVDSDGDGVADCNDNCPGNPDKTEEGVCGCEQADGDTDGDGVHDCLDQCPEDKAKTVPGACGCGQLETDTDQDGTPDCEDRCPNSPDKTSPGQCGCEMLDTDTDEDGVPDCLDTCRTDPTKIQPGVCGCGVADDDTDDDGTPDCDEECPTDPLKRLVGVCGCGVADDDADADGTPDCNDACPRDAGKILPGQCGCGTSDADTDADGVADCVDRCPMEGVVGRVGKCGCAHCYEACGGLEELPEHLDASQCLNMQAGDTCTVSCSEGFVGVDQVFQCAANNDRAGAEPIPCGDNDGQAFTVRFINVTGASYAQGADWEANPEADDVLPESPTGYRIIFAVDDNGNALLPFCPAGTEEHPVYRVNCRRRAAMLGLYQDVCDCVTPAEAPATCEKPGLATCSNPDFATHCCALCSDKASKATTGLPQCIPESECLDNVGEFSWRMASRPVAPREALDWAALPSADEATEAGREVVLVSRVDDFCARGVPVCPGGTIRTNCMETGESCSWMQGNRNVCDCVAYAEETTTCDALAKNEQEMNGKGTCLDSEVKSSCCRTCIGHEATAEESLSSLTDSLLVRTTGAPEENLLQANPSRSSARATGSRDVTREPRHPQELN